MCEYDKKLQYISLIKVNFVENVDKLELEHIKLHAKLLPIFHNINSWMMATENYMSALKQSIDKLKITVDNIEGTSYETQVKNNNHIYPLDGHVNFGYDIKKGK